MIKNILLDMDGTVIDSHKGIYRCVIHALSTLNIPEPPREEMRKCIGPPLTDTFVNVYGVKKEQLWQAMDTFRQRYETTGMYECELYPGIIELIAGLKALGFFVGIASSKNERAVCSILEHFHLMDQFDGIAGSNDDATIETKAEVLQEFFRRHPQCQKEETILVGDTHFDAEGALEVGIFCFGVTYGFGTREELETAGASILFDSPMEVKKYFEEY